MSTTDTTEKPEHGRPGVTFVIPALNEARNIEKTLNGILKNNEIDVEIIVVDNGSSDSTQEIAKSSGALVISAPGVTIAELRNIGAKQASNEAIVFIDADVNIDSNWQKSFIRQHKKMKDNPHFITGSKCLPENRKEALNKYWFSRLAGQMNNSSYVNSGHMITTRTTLNIIGGFDRNLRTAEDVDICMRAKAKGIQVFNNPDFSATHSGYPKNIIQFAKREIWHGAEDFRSKKKIMESKVAIVSILNIFAFAIAIISTIATGRPSFILIYLSAFLSLSLALTVLKFGLKPASHLIPSSLFFSIYLISRSLAPFLKLRRHRA